MLQDIHVSYIWVPQKKCHCFINLDESCISLYKGYQTLNSLVTKMPELIFFNAENLCCACVGNVFFLTYPNIMLIMYFALLIFHATHDLFLGVLGDWVLLAYIICSAYEWKRTVGMVTGVWLMSFVAWWMVIQLRSLVLLLLCSASSIYHVM
jgi:hypothetical protein